MTLAQKDMVTSPNAVVVSAFLMGVVVAVRVIMTMMAVIMAMIVVMPMRMPVRTQCVIVRHDAQLSVFSL
jgi:hypothetical protein